MPVSTLKVLMRYLTCIIMLAFLPSMVMAQFDDPAIMKKAKKLSQKYPIVDGHVDLPYRLRIFNFKLEREYIGIPYQSNEGDFDYIRARMGGLDAPFMSIFIPSSYQTNGSAFALADSLIQMVEFIAHSQPKYFALAYNPKDVIKAKKNRRIALPMGMENGAPIEDDLSKVAYFKSRGISYITLTHSKDNQICDSSYDTTRTWKGLSPFGYKVIDEMVRQGIMIDISHVSDSTFYQVLRHVNLPVIASHSSCRKFRPGFERNMSDDMILQMKKNGGVIMVNFGSTFLDGNVVTYNDSLRTVFLEQLASKGIAQDSDAAKEAQALFSKAHPKLYADVYKVADHIDHIVSIAGVDCVGFGSDFDGVGDSLPMGLKDVSDFPNLIYVLLQRGYTNKDIKKMCSGNLFRVWDTVLDKAGN